MKFKPFSLKLLQKALAGWLLLLLPLAGWAAEPRVVASIKPVHSLVAGVMQGVGEPLLLVPGSASPHDYSLRPSDARAISQAQVVFWIGPELESFLVKLLDNARSKGRAVALLDAPGVVALPLREGGVWESHAHDHAESGKPSAKSHNGHDTDHDAGHDAHIWLDPLNAIAMVTQIVATLSEANPAHRADYERNGAALTERLERLNQQLVTELEPVKIRPYIVFHDAYQYFERRYGLNGVGSVVLNPEQRSGAKRLAEIQARIRELNVRCVFSEPQFQPALVETVIAGSNARRGVLDPEGAELPAGPDAYFQLLQNLSSALRTCLSGT
ncbi:MAG: zinc ABC transporter substrate-binding protein [Candidatus Contendobacter sp.]|jgi:zinc transport system substrate-binding protein|nr:zinc ABC transporter substrate-binding protein [Gammaproteobacteria bacterium]MCC8992345.1 zinc ABC transporter substrate-binding protein [Candidatus Contendobacter sp.]